ncbi:unnamed protein product [Brassica rapa]|uniref:Uncharacterized protein n=1 Tax=Brassica campestris TaxID=3711 RepID=A0A3P5YM47_BRACM|nr:unnamed protein product [Brassica rapa]VDC68189.1 unnamed protein product [Brassica rapa]
MSKRSTSFVPAEADMVRLKRMMDSPVSRSDSSSEPCEGSDCDLTSWRNKYSLPRFVTLRISTSEERTSSYITREIAVTKLSLTLASGE